MACIALKSDDLGDSRGALLAIDPARFADMEIGQASSFADGIPCPNHEGEVLECRVIPAPHNRHFGRLGVIHEDAISESENGVPLNETAPRWERRRPRSSPVDLSNSRHPHHILRFLELTAPWW